MRTVISRIATVKIATNGTDFYILVVVHNSRAEAEHDRTKKILDQIFNDYTVNNDDCTARWLKTYKLTHGEDTEAFIAQLGENIDGEISGDTPVATRN